MATELIPSNTPHLMQIMDPETGHNEISWDPDNEDSVAIARAAGMLIYRTTRGGEDGELMKKFDPEAERIRMTPPVRGG